MSSSMLSDKPHEIPFPSPGAPWGIAHSGSVAFELAALRQEVQALRESLTPRKSVILTGPEVERAFATLKGGSL